MTMFSRMLLCALAVGGLLLAVFSVRPDWAESTGLDLWKLPSLGEWLEAEQQRGDGLDTQLEEVTRRIDSKQHVTVEVIAGRLSLTAAAARFRDLTAGSAEALEHLRFAFDGADDDERFCRAVIAWVRTALRDRSPEESERTAARLEAELQDRLRRDGRVTLPAAPRPGLP
jgi:hypothetical protein